jgi:purine-nucleoside phosphorylase
MWKVYTMIRIFTALYCEAQPFIHFFGLKRQMDIRPFQVFCGKDTVLTVTGTGPVQAAAATAYHFAVYPPQLSDVLINVGVCGAKQENIPVGTLFLCNKINEQGTNRSFYPDILFRHPFREAELTTCCAIVNNKQDICGLLADMEASGIFQAAALFLQTHQMVFLKIVSDHLDGKRISQDMVSELVNTNLLPITNWIYQIHGAFSGFKKVLTENEEQAVRELSERLKLSVSMENQLMRMLKFYNLQHGTLLQDLNVYMDINPPIVTTKNEGKKYFEALKQRFT